MNAVASYALKKCRCLRKNYIVDRNSAETPMYDVLRSAYGPKGIVLINQTQPVWACYNYYIIIVIGVAMGVGQW